MNSAERPRPAARGFTLIELLVVIAIIALLVSILLPSLQAAREQARQVVCMADLAGIGKAMYIYKHDNGGFYPTGGPDNRGAWSEAAWYCDKADLWFYKLADKGQIDPKTLICPSDPFRSQFDYEAIGPTNGVQRANALVASCGYGFNYMIRHDGADNLWNADGNPPRTPEQSILLMEIGPDDQLKQEPLAYGNPVNGSVCIPWRDGGRLLWDDGLREWYTGKTWLVARHRGRANLLTMNQHTAVVPTTAQLKNKILGRYTSRGAKPGLPDCWGHSAVNKFVCAICELNMPHYNFAAQNYWWWTGPLPGQVGWQY